ncbi:MAG TPA: hypothetical protein VHG91_04245 [Longimicrobium sp.]|nr:hypothetical protein [Longimicrobium sp.]
MALFALPLLAGRARRAAECRAAYADGLLFACHPTKWGGLNAFADQLRGALPEGTVVLSRKPTLFWALSGYRSRMYPLSADPEVLLRAARDAGARYLVFDQSGESVRYLLRAVRARREAFCMVPGVRNEYAALVRVGTDGPPLSPDTPPNRYRVCEPGPYAR